MVYVAGRTHAGAVRAGGVSGRIGVRGGEVAAGSVPSSSRTSPPPSTPLAAGGSAARGAGVGLPCGSPDVTPCGRPPPTLSYTLSSGLGLWQRRRSQRCFLVFGPPKRGLSRHALHVPQSSSRIHAGQSPHWRDSADTRLRFATAPPPLSTSPSASVFRFVAPSCFAGFGGFVAAAPTRPPTTRRQSVPSSCHVNQSSHMSSPRPWMRALNQPSTSTATTFAGRHSVSPPVTPSVEASAPSAGCGALSPSSMLTCHSVWHRGGVRRGHSPREVGKGVVAIHVLNAHLHLERIPFTRPCPP